MSPGPLTRIGPRLAFARSKSRWTLMPSPFRNPWSHARRSAWAKTRASPAEVILLRTFSSTAISSSLKSAAANGLTGTGEGTPRSSSGELGRKVRPSEELILSTASLLLIFLFWPPVARAQLLSPFPHSSGTISGTVLVAEENRPAGGLRVQVKSFAGGLAATAVTDAFGRFQVFGLGSGSYNLVIEERGFEPVEETVQLGGFSPDLLLYLKRAQAFRTSQTGSSVSVRELKIPAKAHQAFDKGLEQLKKNDPAGSLARFAQAAAAFPNYYEAYYHMGVADMQLGRNEEAERALQTAIDLSAGHYPPAQYALGMLFCQRREFADAERIIRRGLELDGASWTGHYYLAVAVYSQNRLEEAEKSAHEAILRRPDFPLSYLLLAKIHLRRRDYGTLLDELNTYLKLEPNGPRSGQARQMREAAREALSKSEIVQEPGAVER